MELDDLIDVYVRGTSADDLRDMVASQAYRSVMSEMHRSMGVFGSGGKASHDAMMINIVDRMPGRYAPAIVDQVRSGFSELRQANPLRHDVVVLNHLDGRSRALKADGMGLSLSKYKNELNLGREYLGIRFIELLAPAKQCG